MSTPKEITLKNILDNLDKAQCGLFATYDSLEAVNKYGIELLKSSSLDEREKATLITIGIYHNTLTELLKDMVKKAFDESGKPNAG